MLLMGHKDLKTTMRYIQVGFLVVVIAPRVEYQLAEIIRAKLVKVEVWSG